MRASTFFAARLGEVVEAAQLALGDARAPRARRTTACAGAPARRRRADTRARRAARGADREAQREALLGDAIVVGGEIGAERACARRRAGADPRRPSAGRSSRRGPGRRPRRRRGRAPPRWVQHTPCRSGGRRGGRRAARGGARGRAAPRSTSTGPTRAIGASSPSTASTRSGWRSARVASAQRPSSHSPHVAPRAIAAPGRRAARRARRRCGSANSRSASSAARSRRTPSARPSSALLHVRLEVVGRASRARPSSRLLPALLRRR